MTSLCLLDQERSKQELTTLTLGSVSKWFSRSRWKPLLTGDHEYGGHKGTVLDCDRGSFQGSDSLRGIHGDLCLTPSPKLTLSNVNSGREP